MFITFDAYIQDPADNGEPYFVKTVEFDGNPTHCLQFLAGYTNEYKYHIIREMRIYP